MNNDKRRRTARKRPDMNLRVTDAMSGDPVGHLGNLSMDGMMLIAQAPITDDALYQFVFHLPDPHGRLHPIEVGAHQLWSEPPTFQGQAWVGFRFIDIGPDELTVLRIWIEQPGSEYV